MPSIKNLQQFLIWWNNRFPHDRWFRKKYNISFNSIEHRRLCQIDIKIEYLEDKLFYDHSLSIEDREKRSEEYSKGIWLKDQGDSLNEKQKQLLFEDIDLDKFNNIDFVDKTPKVEDGGS